MGVMSGADAEELDRLGNHMGAAADRLEAIRAEVTAAFGHTHWEGADADHYRGQWNYRLSGLLHTAVTATREASTALHRNANQQRTASGADGGSAGGALSGGAGSGLDVLGLLETGVNIGGGLMLVPGLLDAVKNVHGAEGIKDLLGKPWARALMDEHFLSDIGKDGKGLAGAVHQFEKAGPLALAGLAFDGYGFVHGLATEPGGADTYKAGVDAMFDLAEIGTVECPPLAVGIGIVHLGYDVLEAWHPGAAKEAFEWTGQALVDVSDAAATTITNAEHAVGDAAAAAGNVVSGGVNAVRNFFHW
jgi:hypothetical protein